MPITLEELKSILSQEKIAQIGLKQSMQNFAEGKTIQETLGISDEHMQDFYDIALDYFDNKQYDEAADCFLFLIALNPLESNLWIRSGNAEQALHRYHEALQAYSMATFCDADDPFPHLYSAEVYIELKQFVKARQCLQICLRLIEENPRFIPLREMVNSLLDKELS